MHPVYFVQDFAIVLLVAGFVTLLFHWLRQPVVLGYVLAGLIIGPHTPPFPLIHDENTIRILADLGVVFLMFHLGLEFSFRKLRTVGIAALIAAMIEILLMLCLGYAIGLGFGWSSMDSIFLGAMLSISSTVIIVKALEELGLTQQRFAQLMLGILIVEDILAVGIIALLSGLARTGSIEPLGGFTAIIQLAIFIVASLVIGLLTVPRMVDAVARRKRADMLLTTVLALCFGFCLLSVKLDYSVALAAFLMGALIAESKSLAKVERLIEPLRDLFSAIFFVSVGMLIEPGLILKHSTAIAAITAVVVVGKTVACSLGTLLAGHSGRTSLRVGMGLAQIGEFSFIIAALGLQRGVIDSFLYPIIVTVAVITTFLTPYLLKGSDALADKMSGWVPAYLRQLAQLYADWAGRLQSPREANPVRKLLRRSIWIVAINLTLIIAIFSASVLLANISLPRLEQMLDVAPIIRRTLLWTLAVLLSLPLFIASYRKLQAISMLLAEMSLTGRAIGDLTPAARAVVAQVIPLSALAVFALLLLAASASILPPGKILLVLTGLIALLMWWLRQAFMRIYSRLQIALEQRIGTITAGDPQAIDHSSD